MCDRCNGGMKAVAIASDATGWASNPHEAVLCVAGKGYSTEDGLAVLVRDRRVCQECYSHMREQLNYLMRLALQKTARLVQSRLEL